MNWSIVYLDDIIIFSQDAASHIERLEAVFQKLAKQDSSLSPPSVNFLRRELSNLGHTVSEEGVFHRPQESWGSPYVTDWNV